MLVSEKRIIFWTSIGHFANHIGNYITPALLIFLQADIVLSQTERGLLGSIPMIVMVIMSTIVGWIGDKKPATRKALIWVGILGIGIFCILISMATSFLDLVLVTIILGFSLSSYHPLALTYITSLPNKDRNMGINAVSGNAGSAITPFITMIIAVLVNWRFAFLFFGVFQLLIGLSFALFFPGDRMIMDRIEYEQNEKTVNDEGFAGNGLESIVLISLLVLIGATRGPIFRCLSFFTSVVFNDAFSFDKIASSFLTAVVLGVGAFATFLAGSYINRSIIKNQLPKNDRVRIRINVILISTGLSSIMLIFLVLIPEQPLMTMVVYLVITFVFFTGATIATNILSEISSQMGSSIGLMFTGATLTGAAAPAIFGYLADTSGFEASFLFLGITALLSLFLIVLFKYFYRRFEYHSIVG
ncbi:MAG: MFS transporter [Candidatus Hodarchaeales archaeon]